MPGPTGKTHFAEKGRLQGPWWPASPNTATFYCPGCGAIHSLLEFTIAADGSVAPSFVCSYLEKAHPDATINPVSISSHLSRLAKSKKLVVKNEGGGRRLAHYMKNEVLDLAENDPI